ncbi:MAG: DUF1826 domain-containing protein [Cohaesibacter sp.]|nr:DUF1826 domain-containing protein [Cohaesibacter sp.]
MIRTDAYLKTVSQKQQQARNDSQSAAHVLIGREPKDLHHISHPGVAAAIWQRQPALPFQAWMDGLPADDLPDMRTTVPMTLVEEAVHAACDIKKLPRCHERDMLASDIAALAYIFGHIMHTSIVQVRLDVDDEVMCPRFHQDNVSARLLCTYRGPGTQYVLEENRDEPDHVSQMTTGAAGIFRGKRWPSTERSSLLHRSPDPVKDAMTRMLLVIDPAS